MSFSLNVCPWHLATLIRSAIHSKMITETSRENLNISIFGRKHVCRLAYSVNNFENWQLRCFQRWLPFGAKTPMCNLCHATGCIFLCGVVSSPNAQAFCLYSYLYYFANAFVEAKKSWYFYTGISAGSNGNFGGKTGKISGCGVYSFWKMVSVSRTKLYNLWKTKTL